MVYRRMGEDETLRGGHLGRQGYAHCTLVLQGEGRGTLALLRGEAGYDVFRFDIETPAAEETAALEPSEDGSWTCENGHAGNNGNFCTECGAPRPQVPEALTHCANCGYEFGDTVPNFCPNCGQPTK